jgi:arylsulfatase
VTSNTYYDWLIDHVFLLVPAQDYVGAFLQTFRDYPSHQKAASFNLDEVMRKLMESGGGRCGEAIAGPWAERPWPLGQTSEHRSR